MNSISKFTHKVFYDNKVLLIFSLITAVFVWLIVAISFSPTDTAVIKDVPVSIDLTNSVPAQFNLEIFGQSDFTVDVEITGKRYIVKSNSIGKNSVKVIAQTAYVDSAGKHTLTLKATKANDSDEFEITSVSENYIEVFFDVYTQKDFPIEARVNSKGDIVEEGYIHGEPVISAEVVSVSGPATEVNGISKVYAQIDIDKPLTKTRSEAATINAYNENGGVLHYLSYNYDNSEITVTVPVYLVVDKPLTVDFKNTPSAYVENPFACTVTPSTLRAGVQGIESQDDIESINITTVDFCDLKPGVNKFILSTGDIPSVLLTEESDTIEVSVNVAGFVTKKLSVPLANISFVNAPEGYDIKSVTKGLGAVTVVCPEGTAEQIGAASIFAVVDLTDADVDMKNQEFPAKLSVANSTDSWVYGKYTVTVSR